MQPEPTPQHQNDAAGERAAETVSHSAEMLRAHERAASLNIVLYPELHEVAAFVREKAFEIRGFAMSKRLILDENTCPALTLLLLDVLGCDIQPTLICALETTNVS